MRNKVALVTGGMGGIGTAVCQHLAREGAQVVVGYQRDSISANLWVNKQREQGYDFFASYVDVTDFESCLNLVNYIELRFGRIDILVNNAGINQDAQLYKMDLEAWRSVIQTNLDSVFNMTRHAINGMVARGYGRIINISSINGQKGQFGQANYAAAKAGIHGFTMSLAQEVARKGVTVNTISPGYVETNMLKSMPNKVLEKVIDQIPLGRLGRPDEVARAVGFLAAEQSEFVTGANLPINGGQYLS